VLGGNFVTKVIYLPNAEYQEIALAGVETLVSTRLDPGLDAITEARSAGHHAIVRLGNKDLEVPAKKAKCTAPISRKWGTTEAATVRADPMAWAPDRTCCQPSGRHERAAMGHADHGTPIGLPGPPHIPLGGPAGLRSM